MKPPAKLVLEHSIGCAQLCTGGCWDAELWGFWLVSKASSSQTRNSGLGLTEHEAWLEGIAREGGTLSRAVGKTKQDSMAKSHPSARLNACSFLPPTILPHVKFTLLAQMTHWSKKSSTCELERTGVS